MTASLVSGDVRRAASLFRALGFGGSCPECDTTVLLDDPLGEGVIATA